jgi:glycosyltransferase involved in cell wall biosynthesis
MVTIYTITYNEEKLIKFFVNHYQERFPGCEINIFDNYSTDRTTEIAKELNCNVIFYDTNNTLSDSEYLKIKNNCWETSKTDWVIVCDCDELLEITIDDLYNSEFNIIKTEGYSIMNFDEGKELNLLDEGFRDFGFDKSIMFNSNEIDKMNYSPGCHNCQPQPKLNCVISYSEKKYRLLHYKYLGPNYTVERHKMFGLRLSDDNKKNGWGIHYNFSSESIIQFYSNKQKELIKLL